MSAHIKTSSLALLRLRRQFDVDAVDVWFGVMAFLGAAATIALAAA